MKRAISLPDATNQWRSRVKAERRVYELHEVYRHYLSVVDGEITLSAAGSEDLAGGWRGESSWGGDFYGATADEIRKRISGGFDFDASMAPDVPAEVGGEGPRWTWSEFDGEYEHEVFLSGEPACYLDRRVDQAKPGINVDVAYMFCADINAETISAYGQWVGGLLTAIETQGYDVALTVTSTLDNLYGDNKRQETAIRVSRFGEPLVMRDYAVLFSPGGYRHLMFAAKTIAEVEEGLNTVGGLGRVIPGDGWGVDYDEEARCVAITAGSLSGQFPVEDMNAMLKDVQARF